MRLPSLRKPRLHGGAVYDTLNRRDRLHGLYGANFPVERIAL